MTQFNPYNKKYQTSIVCTREAVYLIAANVKNVKSGRYLKNPKILVGKVIKHRYSSSAPVVEQLEQWLDVIDLQDVFVKATTYPPETIWDGSGFTIDFSTPLDRIVEDVFTRHLFNLVARDLEYLDIEDDSSELL